MLEEFTFSPQASQFLETNKQTVQIFESMPETNGAYETLVNGANLHVNILTSTQETKNIPHGLFPLVVAQTTSGTSIHSEDAVTTFLEYGTIGAIKGQLLSVTIDDANASTQGATDSEIEPRKVVAADYIAGQYPSVIKSILSTNDIQNIKTNLEYDLRFGKPTSTKDASNIESLVSYDNFGRPTVTESTTGTRLEQETVFCSDQIVGCSEQYAENAVYKTSQKVYKVEDGLIESETHSYTDAFGRNLANVSLNMNGIHIIATKEYDERGRLVKESAPFCNSAGCDGPKYTQYTYSDIENTKSIILPDGSSSVITTEHDIAGISKTTRVAGLKYKDVDQVEQTRSQKKVSYANSLGLTTRVEDWKNSSDFINTEFRYDALDRLIYTKVNNSEIAVSASDSETLIAYDNVKNIKAILEPNTGLSISKMNVLGELVLETQKGLDITNGTDKQTRYQYDKLGRLINKLDVTEGKADQWFYDRYPIDTDGVWAYTNSNCTLGQLCEVSANGGLYRERYSYIQADKDGEGNVRQINTLLKHSAQTSLRNYNSQISYDKFG